jgi:hypothetical protein
MEERGLFWPDVQAVINHPEEVKSQGMDEYGRPKWIIRGEAVLGDDIQIVCAIEINQSETEFITLYWEDRYDNRGSDNNLETGYGSPVRRLIWRECDAGHLPACGVAKSGQVRWAPLAPAGCSGAGSPPGGLHDSGEDYAWLRHQPTRSNGPDSAAVRPKIRRNEDDRQPLGMRENAAKPVDGCGHSQRSIATKK